ncbi:hypothetical protein PSN45_005332 [Yamadazyma tenuis]|uniref:uncharacterized protein n=1 Tax=Candida tenuis TaxID=2315449 RepID=UPI00279A8459|nr:hypothetical protein PSN45_005332 [Yamadazyma tenuis]
MFSNKVIFSLAAATIALGASTTNPYATFPSVPHTASINGFADRIYADLPSCAQACVKQDTGITPCPYWDTGCLCVITNWSGEVADCVASACAGSEVGTFTSLATSLCSSAGVPSPYLFLPDSASAALISAASRGGATTTAESSAAAATTSSPPATTEEATSAAATTGVTTSAPSTEENTAVAASSAASSAANEGDDDDDDDDESSAPASSAPASSVASAEPSVATQSGAAGIKGVSVIAGLAAVVALL